MTYSEFKRFLKKSGCYKECEGAKHELWFSPVTGNTFPIGRHNSEEVPKGTLNAILKQAGLKL